VRRRGLALFAVAAAAASSTVAVTDAAGPQPRIAGPLRVTPGTTVSYRVTGLPPRARVTVWLSPTINRGGNCCGVRPFIRGSRATAAGVARPRFRWPRTYQKCGAASGCERVPWLPRQRVDVLVTWNSLSGRTLRVVRIR
jgi:hypothetical protein